MKVSKWHFSSASPMLHIGISRKQIWDGLRSFNFFFFRGGVTLIKTKGEVIELDRWEASDNSLNSVGVFLNKDCLLEKSTPGRNGKAPLPCLTIDQWLSWPERDLEEEEPKGDKNWRLVANQSLQWTGALPWRDLSGASPCLPRPATLKKFELHSTTKACFGHVALGKIITPC